MSSISIPRRRPQPARKSRSVSHNDENSTSQHRLHPIIKWVLDKRYFLLIIVFILYCLWSGWISLNRYILLFLGFTSSFCCWTWTYTYRIMLASVIIFNCYSIIRTLYCLVILDICLYNILSLALFGTTIVLGYYIRDKKDDLHLFLFAICIGDIIIKGLTINVYGAVFIGLSCVIIITLMLCIFKMVTIMFFEIVKFPIAVVEELRDEIILPITNRLPRPRT